MREHLKRADELAEATGLSREYLRLVIYGWKIPSPSTAVKLEKVTGVERLAWLFPDEYDNPLLYRRKSKNRVSSQ